MSDLLTEIKVEESDTQADLATLSFTDSELVLQDILQEGLSIQIDMGRAEAHALLFRGVITHVRPGLASEGQPKLEVEAMNSLIKLALRPRTRTWQNTTVSQIVRDIAQSNQLRPGRIEPEDDAEISERQPRHQQEETDLAFLFRLAQDYGSRLYIGYEDVADTLNFVATSKLLEDAPLNQPLVFNDNLEDFSASADSFAADAAPALAITDPTTGEPDSVETAAASAEERHTPDADRIARLTEGGARVAQLVAQTAASRERPEEVRQSPARLLGNPSRPASDRSGTYGDRTRNLGQRAEGRTTGNIWLQPRRRVRIEGYGGRWSGVWYVAEVEHQLDIAQRRYTTSFTCTR